MSSIFYIFSCIAFVSAIDDDVMEQFLKTRVNASISACDNFYRHVCPKDIQLEQTLVGKLMKHFANMQMSAMEYFAHVYPASSKIYNDVLSGKLRRIPTKEQNFAEEKTYDLLLSSQLWKVLSWQRLVSQSVWMQSLMKTQEELFQELLEEQIKAIKESKWIANYVGIKVAEKILREMKLYSYNVSKPVWDETMTYLLSSEEKLAKCLKSFPNVDCYYEATALDKNSTLQHMINTTEIITAPLSIYNAYNDEGNVVIFLPILYAASFKNTAHVYGMLGAVMSHEIGHSVGSKRSTLLPYITNSTGCIVKHMRKVCELQDEVEPQECLSGKVTLSEDVTDSPSIKNTINVFKRKYNPDEREMKEFFYAMAAGNCFEYMSGHPPNGNGEPDEHSIPGVRVNAEMMLLQEFQDTFKCKAGDFMTTAPEDKCHLYGPDAGETKKSSFIRG